MPETRSNPALLPPVQISQLNGNGNGNGYFNGHTNGHTNNGNRNGTETTTPPPLYTARAAPTTPRRSQPTKILGKIDENGGMSPDIPIRNPRRKQGSPNGPPSYDPRTFFTSLWSTSPPNNEFDSVKGPGGERLSDVRENRRSASADMKQRRKRSRKLVCLAAILVVVAVLVAIGVVIGLKRMKKSNDDNDDNGQSPSQNQTDTLTAFPVGAYTFLTYLLTQTSACTPNPATWRCYPYTLYSTSQTGSLTTLNWIVSGTNTSAGPKYSIGSSSNPFALPFSDAQLTLSNEGSPDEYWGFSTFLEKVVYPDAVITPDGNAARCYYNDSMISAKLYTKRQTMLPGNEVVSADEKVKGSWPGAVEIWQTSSQPPECFEVVRGQDRARVLVEGAVTEADCKCEYADFQET